MNRIRFHAVGSFFPITGYVVFTYIHRGPLWLNGYRCVKQAVVPLHHVSNAQGTEYISPLEPKCCFRTLEHHVFENEERITNATPAPHTVLNFHISMSCGGNMGANWNKIWRYVHLSLGLMLVVYHARIAYFYQGMFGIDTLWSQQIDEFVSIYFIFFVMWTGLAKWPIYPWYKKRQNKKKRAKKALESSPTES